MTDGTTVPDALRELWRQRACLLASNVATDGREHREIAQAASLIRQDYHDRFLVELLQNANDQALLGGVLDSTVVVARSPGLLAVSNGGQALTPRNLERLSSLADSDKSGVLVGNKGVGFKAVYQVTDAPEIYSASAARRTGTSENVFADFGVGIALEQHPFQQQALVTAVEDDVRSFFAENRGLADALERKGFKDPLVAVRPEFARVAGFKFPLARSRGDLVERLSDLQITDAQREVMRTLVVLPLRDQHASEDVERAIDRLVGTGSDEPGQAELAVLFLAGVGTIVVLDHVRDRRWVFSCGVTRAEGPLTEATVSVIEPGGTERSTRFWVYRRDALDCATSIAEARKRIVAGALQEFGLEAWTADDPLPVTIALPVPVAAPLAMLGPAGRFCLGLPTQQRTGVPAHVDARFFATISRTGLDFGLPYNGLLLEVAAELFGELLGHLRQSTKVEDRRAATLAFHRSPGALAEAVFTPGSVADGAIVLGWDGTRFLRRSDCRLPTVQERQLLRSLSDVLFERPDLLSQLPDEALLVHAPDVLESIGLPPLQASPHPWLQRDTGAMSAVELAAQLHRSDGPDYWEDFAGALLACFAAADLQDQSWLPVGDTELAAPSRRVFLPARAETEGDDEEVANVPIRVAAIIRLVDGRAMRLREDGRALTKLALRLVEARLVRQPRKTELLEDALFPALEKSIDGDGDISLELFGQAVAWIASMRDVSRKKLDCKQARVPVAAPAGEKGRWASAQGTYLGERWGLPLEHERLLSEAYPDRRLLSFETIRDRFGLPAEAVASWRAAVEVMGVRAVPRVVVFPDRSPPLQSDNRRLLVVGTPVLGEPKLDAIYRAYVDYLATHATRWTNRFPHHVDAVRWVDGLEGTEGRQAIVDLMLMHPEAFLRECSVLLSRVDDQPEGTVDAMWVFALAKLNWPVFPGERGVGRERIRVPATQLWRLPDNARRSGYAQVINVVPHAFSAASSLLGALGIPSVEDASLGRLFEALGELASRLDEELLHTRREALSLANELYAQIDERLERVTLDQVQQKIRLPLLRDRRLEAVDPQSADAIVLFDDEPARARHIIGIERAFRVPIARDSKSEKIHALFSRTWGQGRFLRTSTAKIELEFTPSPLGAESFLTWLHRQYPHGEVAAELAALLTLGGERSVRAEPVSRAWKDFQRLKIVFGSFGDSNITSFYDRTADTLSVSLSMERHDVVAKTWELAGARSQDLWAGYARALRDSTDTHVFLRDHEISEVEIVEVADAAGLHRLTSVDALAPALLAARCHMMPGTSLDDAAAWLATVGNRSEDVARELGHPEIATLLDAALGLRSPDGEMQVVHHLGVPWSLWQDAVLRRDGQRYVFAESLQRYRLVREHLIAVVRELGARDSSTDLKLLSSTVAGVLAVPVPDAVRYLPLDVSAADETAWHALRAALATFGSIARPLAELPAPPWQAELPIPEEATRRGVRLFRDAAMTTREIEATTSVQAIVQVAARLATSIGEQIDATAILGDPILSARTQGEWAHVYAAQLLLRSLIEPNAPETFKRLSAVQAFREVTTVSALVARFPDIPRTEPMPPQPKQQLLGLELTAADIQLDLESGSGGVLGAKLASAAALGLDPAILNGARNPLPPLPGGGGSGGGGGRGGSTTRSRREPELVGDIGEAFVHEWLTAVLGADYGPDCWVSESRERYGLPKSGKDGLGYDFKVPDPDGRLFGIPAAAYLIEVKSTTTDGSGSFPMSSAEWDHARRCHEKVDDAVYVILRVVQTDSRPKIGDFVIDPFAAYRRGEIRLVERDLWVRVAPRTTMTTP